MAGLFGGKSGGGFLGTGISNNALMHAGLGLLSSSGTSNPWSGLASGFQAGTQMDMLSQQHQMRQQQFEMQQAEMKRQQKLDEEFNAFLTGGRAAPGTAPPPSGLAGSGVDPTYQPPGMGGGAGPGLTGAIPISAATPGINPDAPGGAGPAPGILQKIRNTPGGLLALRGMGREGASKFLLDQMVNPTQRKMYKGADGFNYYADTNERVNPNVQAKPDYKTVKGVGLVQMVNGSSQVVVPEGQESGAYDGTSMDAQNANILLNGDPSTPTYAAAFNMMAQEKAMYNPATGQTITTTPDMSAFRKPTFAGYGEDPTRSGGGGGKGGVSTTGRKLFSADQAKVAGFANRMASALPILDGLEAKGVGVPELTAEAAGAFGETARNLATSPELQQFNQSKSDFITAVLRRESGALISEEEFEREDKKFFPQIGDSGSVLKQKAAARRRAVENFKKESQGAYSELFSKSGEPDLSGSPDNSDLESMNDEDLQAAIDKAQKELEALR